MTDALERPLPASDDPWSVLRSATRARVALGRAGDALPTARELEFRAAHEAVAGRRLDHRGRLVRVAHDEAAARRARAAGASAVSSRTRPASSSRSIRASHASNSGAGRSPSTERVVSTSEKASDW